MAKSERSTISTQVGNIRIYCCGGGGINIGSTLQALEDSVQVKGFANVSICFIDTSKANVTKIRDSSKYYHIEELDGSGQVRKENFKDISNHTKRIIETFKPMDLNIVISTAGGGSGSVIGPSLISDLLERDEQVIGISIGDTSTELLTKNTINTIKSFDNISSKKNKPLVLAYIENDENNSRDTVNSKIKSIVVVLAALYSKQNLELDSKDLENWLDYTKIPDMEPKIQPKLVSLFIDVNEVTTNPHHSVITVATLALDDTKTKLSIPASFQPIGFISPDVDSINNMNLPYHFLIVDGYFSSVIQRLEKQLKEFINYRSSRINPTPIVSNKDRENSEDNGLIL